MHLFGRSFFLNAHGDPGSPPASGVREYLVSCGAEVDCLHHPLGPEQGGAHVLERWGPAGVLRTTRTLPSRPPVTFPLDLALRVPGRGYAAWIGFDPFATVRGLWARTTGRTESVIHWAVDFTDDRFGAGTLLTRAYDLLDGACRERPDLRVELSSAARDARDRRFAGRPSAPTRVVPVGLWPPPGDRARPREAAEQHRVVFLGHLVDRMGVDQLIRAMARPEVRATAAVLDVVGRGPAEEQLRALVAEAGLDDGTVVFHGFQQGDRLEKILAAATIAAAPYRAEPSSFSQYADPSKLKTYLAAQLPIVLTRVPPNAAELEAAGAAVLVDDDPAAVAAAIAGLASDPDAWRRSSAAARDLARSYEWPTLLEPVFRRFARAA